MICGRVVPLCWLEGVAGGDCVSVVGDVESLILVDVELDAS